MDNVKGQLQELFQVRGLPLPRYSVKSSGPPHRPVVVCTVTVRGADGRQLNEQVEVQGGKKKEAEKLAARKMLQTLQGGGGGGRTPQRPPSRGHPLSPPSRPPGATVEFDSPSVTARPARSPLRSPSPSSSGGKSPVAALQERLQAAHLEPTYTETRPLSSPFRFRCQVQGGGRTPGMTTEGEGNSKRSAKEAAARLMLRKMDEKRNFATAPVPPEVAKPVTPEPRIDHSLVEAKVASLSPKYHYWSSQGEVGLCTATADELKMGPSIHSHSLVLSLPPAAVGLLSGQCGGRGCGLPHHRPRVGSHTVSGQRRGQQISHCLL